MRDWLDSADLDQNFVGTTLSGVTSGWEIPHDSPYQEDIRRAFLYRLGTLGCFQNMQGQLIDVFQGALTMRYLEDLTEVGTLLLAVRRRLIGIAQFPPIDGNPFAQVETTGKADLAYRTIQARVDTFLALIQGEAEELPPKPIEVKPKPTHTPKKQTKIPKQRQVPLDDGGRAQLLEILLPIIEIQQDRDILTNILSATTNPMSYSQVLGHSLGIMEISSFEDHLHRLFDTISQHCSVRIFNWGNGSIQLQASTRTLRIVQQKMGRPITVAPQPRRERKETHSGVGQTRPPETPQKVGFDITQGPTFDDPLDEILVIPGHVEFLRALIYRFHCVDQRYHAIIDVVLESSSDDISFDQLRKHPLLKTWDVQALQKYIRAMGDTFGQAYGERLITVRGAQGVHRLAMTGVQYLKQSLGRAKSSTSSGPDSSGPVLDLIGEKPKKERPSAPHETPGTVRTLLAQARPKAVSLITEEYEGPDLPEDGNPVEILKLLYIYIQEHRSGLKWTPNQKSLWGQLLNRKKLSMEECKRCIQKEPGHTLQASVRYRLTGINNIFLREFSFEPIRFVGDDSFELNEQGASAFFARVQSIAPLYFVDRSLPLRGESDSDQQGGSQTMVEDQPGEEKLHAEAPKLASEFERYVSFIKTQRVDLHRECVIYLLAYLDGPRKTPQEVASHLTVILGQSVTPGSLRGHIGSINMRIKPASIDYDTDGYMLKGVSFGVEDRAVMEMMREELTRRVAAKTPQPEPEQTPEPQKIPVVTRKPRVKRESSFELGPVVYGPNLGKKADIIRKITIILLRQKYTPGTNKVPASQIALEVFGDATQTVLILDAVRDFHDRSRKSGGGVKQLFGSDKRGGTLQYYFVDTTGSYADALEELAQQTGIAEGESPSHIISFEGHQAQLVEYFLLLPDDVSDTETLAECIEVDLDQIPDLIEAINIAYKGGDWAGDGLILGDPESGYQLNPHADLSRITQETVGAS